MRDDRYSIPVVLFIFKRSDTVLKILGRVAQVRPKRLYLLGDEGRNDEEKHLVAQCRKTVEQAVTWDCELIKYYAEENRGVHDNIGLGAKWVFEREKTAVFLEDDNLPEVTFFQYCAELLEKYEDNDDVLWICGTNYLGSYAPPSGDSYMFTKHLLPCGWASWAHKFTKYYDAEFDCLKTPADAGRLKSKYTSKKLFDQQYYCMRKEMFVKKHRGRYNSWDYQMAFSVRNFDKYGISPCNNQIKNIGADEFSEHGGTNLNMVMTKRFCGMPSYPLEFPQNHPNAVAVDGDYEKKIEKIILLPLPLRVKNKTKRFMMKLLGREDVTPFSWLVKISK